MAAPALDSVTPVGDDIEADEHKQSIIQSYIAEFKDKGCVNTVVRLLREILPEHIYIHLINAVDKEGSILTVLINAVRIYIALMYVAPMMPNAPPGAPPGTPGGAPQQAPQQPQDMQNAIVQQVLAKVLEKQFGGEDEGGGGFDLRGMMKQMMAMMFMPMIQQMMQRMQASMASSMSSMMQMPSIPMPNMPNMLIPPMPNTANTNQQQQPQQQQPQQQSSQTDQKNVQRLDIL
jgi:hypothetical protein